MLRWKIKPRFRLGFYLNPLNPINVLSNLNRKILLLTLFLTFLVINVFPQTVSITKTGAKYRSEGCRYLSKSKISNDLSDAVAKVYGACSVCKPTVKVTSSNLSKPESTKPRSLLPPSLNRHQHNVPQQQKPEPNVKE